ncbi:hypothetical protein THAOC_13642 [Thalassiosira oceanica]|uniref:Uncharacterized protein n=1 Tax=Thalassiosira oceanica TaxID=159749 RepID=K0SJG0_THAOC|nr:hypothetical protein THAOC_13642 [Thalassiosira oceanica]|eukprot:EJK65485.1 hypothetical protein THAOC_13642 [Thalassiosira oceanica]
MNAFPLQQRRVLPQKALLCCWRGAAWLPGSPAAATKRCGRGVLSIDSRTSCGVDGEKPQGDEQVKAVTALLHRNGSAE